MTTVKPKQTTDRYAILQRKFEDLERTHNEEKKSHQVVIERLKFDVSRYQKAHADAQANGDKHKKQSDTLEQKLGELKKSLSVAEAEVRDLRVKLRLAEHERTQRAGKASDTQDLKKVEIKRKDDIREKDRKIAELEKALAAEKKKRAGMTDADHELLTKTQLELAEKEEREATLLEELDAHKVMLQRCASAYAELSSRQTHHKDISPILQNARLERKLANSEDQVVALAHLIRQMKEANHHLTHCLESAKNEILYYGQALAEAVQERLAREEDQRERVSFATAPLGFSSLSVPDEVPFDELYRLQCEELLEAYASANVELELERLEATHRKSELEEARALRKTAEELSNTLKQSLEILQGQVKDLETRLSQEKDTIGKLTLMVQKGRMTEEALRAENEQLSTELTDAERYQDAYYSLSDEVEGLLARNALAEDEAARLSRFNAEIIGHHNPAQKILYVERIRNELAETKQRLIVAMREHENVRNVNDGLQHELSMYKSVMVPVESRPKTNITRINRAPLVALNQSWEDTSVIIPSNGGASLFAQQLEDIDMTLEEIM